MPGRLEIYLRDPLPESDAVIDARAELFMLITRADACGCNIEQLMTPDGRRVIIIHAPTPSPADDLDDEQGK